MSNEMHFASNKKKYKLKVYKVWCVPLYRTYLYA
jgi:hypothetical protein